MLSNGKGQTFNLHFLPLIFNMDFFPFVQLSNTSLRKVSDSYIID